ncbi:MAG: sigma-70 family RNA polymerase sigma factor [Pirellulales bacterium]
MQREPSAPTEALLKQAAGGNSTAVSELFQLHRPRLRRMVVVHLDERLRARVDPSDVVQEVLIEAHRRLPEYLQARPIMFYPWLRQLAWDRLLKVHRHHLIAKRRNVRREASRDWEVSDESVNQLAQCLLTDETTQLQRIINDEMHRRIRQALDQLPSEDRKVLVLRFLEQLSTAETATVLGVSESAVKMRQLRALQRVQALLRVEESEQA